MALRAGHVSNKSVQLPTTPITPHSVRPRRGIGKTGLKELLNKTSGRPWGLHKTRCPMVAECAFLHYTPSLPPMRLLPHTRPPGKRQLSSRKCSFHQNHTTSHHIQVTWIHPLPHSPFPHCHLVQSTDASRSSACSKPQGQTASPTFLWTTIVLRNPGKADYTVAKAYRPVQHIG